jgi:hypothetical protein
MVHVVLTGQRVGIQCYECRPVRNQKFSDYSRDIEYIEYIEYNPDGPPVRSLESGGGRVWADTEPRAAED